MHNGCLRVFGLVGEDLCAASIFAWDLGGKAETIPHSRSFHSRNFSLEPGVCITHTTPKENNLLSPSPKRASFSQELADFFYVFARPACAPNYCAGVNI